jgi:hypothetical protein
VENLRRQAVDADVAAAVAKGRSALGSFDLGGALSSFQTAERKAETQIRRIMKGYAHGKRVDSLLAFARERHLSVTAVLEAMVAGASDSTQGDMVAAGIAYAVAAANGDDIAEDVRAGRIKVDDKEKLEESSPDARRTGGIYVPMATDPRLGQHDSEKGDTLYLPSSIDPARLADRDTVIHELKHATDDKAAPATGTQTPRSFDLEVAAYTADARYMLNEIATAPDATRRKEAVASVAGAWDNVRMFAAITASRADKTRLEPIVKEIDAAASERRKQLGMLSLDFDQSEDDLRNALLGEVMRLHQIGPDNRVRQDSLSGESVLDRP